MPECITLTRAFILYTVTFAGGDVVEALAGIVFLGREEKPPPRFSRDLLVINLRFTLVFSCERILVEIHIHHGSLEGHFQHQY